MTYRIQNLKRFITSSSLYQTTTTKQQQCLEPLLNNLDIYLIVDREEETEFDEGEEEACNIVIHLLSADFEKDYKYVHMEFWQMLQRHKPPKSDIEQSGACVRYSNGDKYLQIYGDELDFVLYSNVQVDLLKNIIMICAKHLFESASNDSKFTSVEYKLSVMQNMLNGKFKD